MVSVTFQFDSLAEARAWLQSMPEHDDVVRPTGQSLGSRRTAEQVRKAASDIAKWWPHLGEKSREFWVIAANFAAENSTFTFDELANDTISAGSLKSRHRNSYRAIKAEHADDPLEQEWSWEHGRNFYYLADGVRDAILAAAENQD
jgi:hypothetical protein